MQSETRQVDQNGNSVAQTQSGPEGAADVNVAGGVVGIDPQANVVIDGGGRYGVTTTTGTTAVTGRFRAMTILADATFTVFREEGGSGDTMTGFVVPANTTLFGNITAYTLSSGKVRAYV